MDKHDDKNDFKCLDVEKRIILKWMVATLFWDIVRRRLVAFFFFDRGHSVV